MKKRILSIILMLILVLAVAVPAYAVQSQSCVVTGTQNYLALRSQPKTSASNEIGKLHNGDTFFVTQWTSNGFAYGYTTANRWGYVNSNYLRLNSYIPQQPQGEWRTVSGVNNYLGLRTTATRNNSDEIGRLYNGQSFCVLEYRRDGFAYGYTTDGKYGYVVSAYLK